jgi:hypothetical protein
MLPCSQFIAFENKSPTRVDVYVDLTWQYLSVVDLGAEVGAMDLGVEVGATDLGVNVILKSVIKEDRDNLNSLWSLLFITCDQH